MISLFSNFQILATWASIRNNRILASRASAPLARTNGYDQDNEPDSGRDDRRPYVLLVDPDRDTGAAIVDALRGEGYDVEWFVDGEQAISFIQKDFIVSQRTDLDSILVDYLDDGDLPRVAPSRPRVPSLILIDLLVPVSNGWRLAATIQQRDALRQVPMMIVAGDPRASNRDDIVSPELSDLLSAVRRLAGPPVRE